MAIAGEGEYLGKGSSGKVKLAEDENGFLYALKVAKVLAIPALEKNILEDLSQYQGGG